MWCQDKTPPSRNSGPITGWQISGHMGPIFHTDGKTILGRNLWTINEWTASVIMRNWLQQERVHSTARPSVNHLIIISILIVFMRFRLERHHHLSESQLPLTLSTNSFDKTIPLHRVALNPVWRRRMGVVTSVQNSHNRHSSIRRHSSSLLFVGQQWR